MSWNLLPLLWGNWLASCRVSGDALGFRIKASPPPPHVTFDVKLGGAESLAGCSHIALKATGPKLSTPHPP
jgi:hypothetical protein